MEWKNKQEKKEAYELFLAQLSAVLKAEKDPIANLANTSAMLNEFLPNTVFAGFYLFDGTSLVLGPFQGGVSCTRIALGKGVCGISAEERRTVVVDDVKKFDNYISCDARAKSEIVVPMLQNGKLLGVLDIDASVEEGYDEIDQENLEKVVEVVVSESEFLEVP
ncbi:GAF domain-containing protein [Pilibacter termitis]|uniref:GAF domain-containing protein n=1 Tax=Pilibacter termitis TaxID=263852 RepID=A0A1T4LWT6_9ENTE|nr:GAF domain-containing protein [Pilibacter termitis]SJZ58948.1 GAF domain-containing protein [Pilibacter termitis]